MRTGIDRRGQVWLDEDRYGLGEDRYELGEDRHVYVRIRMD